MPHCLASEWECVSDKYLCVPGRVEEHWMRARVGYDICPDHGRGEAILKTHQLIFPPRPHDQINESPLSKINERIYWWERTTCSDLTSRCCRRGPFIPCALSTSIMAGTASMTKDVLTVQHACAVKLYSHLATQTAPLPAAQEPLRTGSGNISVKPTSLSIKVSSRFLKK